MCAMIYEQRQSTYLLPGCHVSRIVAAALYHQLHSCSVPPVADALPSIRNQ